MGYYRIKETSLGTNSDYEMAFPGGTEANAKWRYFFVGGAPVSVYMANPTKMKFSIKKTTMDGSPVTGMTFSLLKAGTTTQVAGVSTGDNGIATFTKIATGTYYIQESSGNTGLSTAYFKDIFKAQNSAYANLVEKTPGYTIGYTYTLSGIANSSDKNKDVIITGMSTLGSNQTLLLEVKNPEYVNVQLEKQDIDDENNAPIKSSATFRVYYKPFSAVSGELSMTLPAAEATYDATIAKYTTAAGWTDLAEFTTSSSTGRLNVSTTTSTKRNPGLYVFVEKTPPTGYGPLKDENGKLVVYSAIVTGGMTFDNADLSQAVTPYQAVIDEDTTIPTNYVVTPVDEGEQPVVVIAEDPKMATLKAHKTVQTNNPTGTVLPVINWSL